MEGAAPPAPGESASAATEIEAGIVAGAAAGDVAVTVASAAQSAKEEAAGGVPKGAGVPSPLDAAKEKAGAAAPASAEMAQARSLKDEIAQKGEELQPAKPDEDSADIEE